MSQANICLTVAKSLVKSKATLNDFLIDYDKFAMDEEEKIEQQKQKANKATDNYRAYLEKLLKDKAIKNG